MTRNVTAVLLTGLLLTAGVPARAGSLSNGSFEANVLPSNSFCISFAAPMCAPITGWTGNFYLVNGAPQAISPQQPLPDGVQFAMVQSTNGMAQSVTIDVAGTYELTWSDAGRAAFIGASGNESYDVSFAGNLLGSFSTVSNSPWASHAVIFSAEAGVFSLEIAGKTPFGQGDNSVLLDNFALAPSDVPEPASVALESAALALFVCRRGAARRRVGR